mmetsp:Transcript_39891/g.79829  ORF Transcript_39891/g.79829 Transcript_39891/m.79829 type:complete len:88 (-) Transcript_39891:1451-1714(-)
MCVPQGFVVIYPCTTQVAVRIALYVPDSNIVIGRLSNCQCDAFNHLMHGLLLSALLCAKSGSPPLHSKHPHYIISLDLRRVACSARC